MVGFGWSLIPWVTLGPAVVMLKLLNAIQLYMNTWTYTCPFDRALIVDGPCRRRSARDVGASFPRVPVFTHLMLTSPSSKHVNPIATHPVRETVALLPTHTHTPTPRQHTAPTAAGSDSLEVA